MEVSTFFKNWKEIAKLKVLKALISLFNFDIIIHNYETP